MYNNMIVRRKDGINYNGICFINWLIDIGEKIYICIVERYVDWFCLMRIVLININFVNIIVLLLQMLDDKKNVKIVKIVNFLVVVNDVVCLFVNYDVIILCYIKDIFQFIEKLIYVLINDLVWFVFDLCGNIRVIEILLNNLKSRY